MSNVLADVEAELARLGGERAAAEAAGDDAAAGGPARPGAGGVLRRAAGGGASQLAAGGEGGVLRDAVRGTDGRVRGPVRQPAYRQGRQATVRGFHPTATDALARWIDTRKGLGLRNGPLFCTLDGGPLSDRYVRNLLHRLAARAGVDKRVHPHGMRHSFADELRAAGMDVGANSKLLGHSSIAVTSRYLT